MRSRGSRRWLVAGAVVLAALALVAIGLGVAYPRLGAWAIRKKVGAKLAQRLGRDVRFGPIDVSLGHAVLRDVEVRGPRDGQTPLVHIDRVDVSFDAWRSLVGSVRVRDAALDGVLVTIRRGADGEDNLRDVLDRLRGRGAGAGATVPHAPSGLRPRQVTLHHLRVMADDETTGTTVLVADGDALWTPGSLVAHARGLTATTTAAPKAEVASIEVRKLAGAPPVVTIEGGSLALWPRMALSGIGGKLVANPASHGHYLIDLAGGYGGVPGQLWTAKGELDPATAAGSLDLVAAKFQLDRLAPILANSAVVDYQSTSVDTSLHLALDRDGARFSGEFHLRGLNVGHPMIAAKEVHDLDLSGEIAGSFDRATHRLDLTRGDFVARDVPFSVTGDVLRPRPASREAPDVALGPHGIQALRLRLVIPPIACQKVLDAIPPAMAPYMQGYRMRGVFDTDVHLDIDWNDLDATVLDGHVGLKHCKVVDEPDDSPKRLEDEFEHAVEVEEGEWKTFVVGPSNPDFVPLAEISPYVIKSITTTEDGAFFKHHGFIPSEFRTALVKDLKARAFKYGASSITMQMVKNVLLYREKTLARKLQELFLTWHVEHTLTKERILEIYLNVIEYGPGLYGIGPAAREYFGKAAKDLNPREAAFFSSILPSPKARYKQYCQGTLTKWTEGKIERILALELKRDKLTQEEYDQAMATPLAFVKDGSETEKECLKRVKEAIENARPTNPLAKDQPGATGSHKKSGRHKHGRHKGDPGDHRHPGPTR